MAEYTKEECIMVVKGGNVCEISTLLILIFLAGPIQAGDLDIIVMTEDNAASIDDSALTAAVDQIPLTTLSDTEVQGLLYMAEEEKLAGDVYDTLNQKWNLRVFRNIGNSERTHEAAVKMLLTRYGLSDPTTNAVGEFNNADLQEAYDQLISRGSSSIQNALEVGAEIVETDILDLHSRIDQTDKTNSFWCTRT